MDWNMPAENLHVMVEICEQFVAEGGEADGDKS
jgi:hypothetical protein